MCSKFQNHGNLGEPKFVTHLHVDSTFKRCSKNSNIWSLISRGLVVSGIILLSFTGLASEAHSNTYYLSPSGSDSKAGTSAAPWKTFSFAIPKLKAGDTLILKDGTYTRSNSGLPKINGGTNANNGTKNNPITLKAQNERKALIAGDGLSNAVDVKNVSFWNFEGLRVKSAQNQSATGTNGNVIKVWDSTNLQFRRLLLTHNNRWLNTHLLALIRCEHVLVEESEFYYYHRHAIDVGKTNNSVFRRLYGNSRGHANLSGGFRSGWPNHGEVLVTIYPGSNNIVENSISEGNSMVVDIQATSASVNNKFLGLISLNDDMGATLRARGTGSGKMAHDTQFENFLVVNPKNHGLYARGTKNTKVTNASLIGGKIGFIADWQYGREGDGVYSAFLTNVLAMNTSSSGVRTIDHDNWLYKYINFFNNNLDFNSDKYIRDDKALEPKMGTCKVFIPKNSPLKGKGEGGADIGANILYRYEKGKLTDQPLWDPRTGEFPHGALVRGVNDIPGSSLFDVHKRLNVNANGCTLPENYGEEGEPDLTPKNLSVIRMDK